MFVLLEVDGEKPVCSVECALEDCAAWLQTEAEMVEVLVWSFFLNHLH